MLDNPVRIFYYIIWIIVISALVITTIRIITKRD